MRANQFKKDQEIMRTRNLRNAQLAGGAISRKKVVQAEYEVEEIVDKRVDMGKIQYLLKWKGYNS